MSASSSVESVQNGTHGTRVPWGDVLLSAIASVSWALIGMAGTAALGLHLLEADAAGSLGPMTAAVVALGAGGSVTPSGDASAFGLKGATAHTAVTITPLGVSLVGALLLSWFFLRSLRAAGVVIAPAELLARAGAVVALFVATLGGLAWAGHDVITIDGGSLGLDKLPGAGGGGGGGVNIPGLGDIGNIGGLLPDNIGNLIHAKAAVGFTVDTAPTLLGGLGWSAGILLIALLASRRTPLPRGWEAVHRVVRPAVSAIVTVMLVAVAAGLAAAVYAAIGDDHPKRIFGAALLGAPNGTWLGIPIGLFVPFDGKATGVLTKFLPHPLDNLLTTKTDQSVTLGRLADLDGRVWLLGVAAAVMMLLAGVLAAVRTPVGAGGPVAGGPAAGSGGAAAGSDPRSAEAWRTGANYGGSPRGGGAWGGSAARPAGSGADGAWGGGAAGGQGSGGSDSGGVRGPGALGFAGRCALRLGVVTALTLPLLAWLTEVSVNASLSVLGFDAFGAGIELHGHLGMALLLGALWGAGAGAAGALLAWATGAAGRRAAPLALGGGAAGAPAGDAGYPQYARVAGAEVPAAGGEPGVRGGGSGPYTPGTPYRAPNPATNPYLQLPDAVREPEDARSPDGARQGEGPPPGAGARPSGAPDRGGPSGDARDPGGSPPPATGNSDMYGAPTVARPIGSPPPRKPRRPRRGNRPKSGPDEGPPPPQPPPPPGRPKGDR